MFGGTDGRQNVMSEKKNSRKAVTGFLQNDEKWSLLAFLVCVTLHLGNTVVISAVCVFESKLKVFERLHNFLSKPVVVHHNPLGFLKRLEINFR